MFGCSVVKISTKIKISSSVFQGSNFVLVRNPQMTNKDPQKGLPKSDLIKPAIIAAAEIVLHRKQDQDLDETLPIALQTSQMAVYPELVFQVSILRDKIDKLISSRV